MSKRNRCDGPGRVFHVTGRVNWRAWHLNEIEAKLLFARLLTAAAADFGMTISAFVLMDNHFHLVCESPPDPLFRVLTSRRTPCRHLARYPDGHQKASVLSQFMRKVRWTLSIRRQRELGLSGRFWESAFDARPVLTPLSLAVRIAYDHRNPVKAGMVEEPQSYRWSSARAWVDGRPADVPVTLTNLPFGAEFAELRRAVLAYQGTPLLDALEHPDELLSSERRIDEELTALGLPLFFCGVKSAQ